MIFYLCQTEPPQLVNSQARAKALGMPWAQHDVPTNSADLEAYVNVLLAAAPEASAPAPAAVEPAPPAAANWRLANGECPACFRNTRAAGALVRSFDISFLSAEVDKVWDAGTLQSVIGFTEQRLAFVVKAALT